jgi:hypothetical protein
MVDKSVSVRLRESFGNWFDNNINLDRDVDNFFVLRRKYFRIIK